MKHFKLVAHDEYTPLAELSVKQFEECEDAYRKILEFLRDYCPVTGTVNTFMKRLKEENWANTISTGDDAYHRIVYAPSVNTITVYKKGSRFTIEEA